MSLGHLLQNIFVIFKTLISQHFKEILTGYFLKNSHFLLVLVWYIAWKDQWLRSTKWASTDMGGLHCSQLPQRSHLTWNNINYFTILLNQKLNAFICNKHFITAPTSCCTSSHLENNVAGQSGPWILSFSITFVIHSLWQKPRTRKSKDFGGTTIIGEAPAPVSSPPASYCLTVGVIQILNPLWSIIS